MHIPKRPTPINELAAKLAQGGNASRLLTLVGNRQMVDGEGRYMHWDDFRRRAPQAGLTIEESWFATRTARVAAAQFVPLLDVANRRFSYCEPPELRSGLQYVDMNAGGTLATEEHTISPSQGGMYFARSLVEEPFNSSFIEGAATTRRIAKELILEQRAPKTRDELMVLNNYKGMEYIKSIVSQPLTVESILEAHRIITDGTLEDPEDAGRLRQDNDVAVFDETTNEILHQPPSFETLTERLERLCEFANSVDQQPGAFVHPIVRAFILHFALAYDHPFADGNGRTARALFYWSALRARYWLIEYVSISAVIAQSKAAYGLAFLHTETDESDLTYFLLHQAKTLRTAIDRLLAYADRKRVEYNTFQKRVMENDVDFNNRQTMLLNDALRNRFAYTTVAEHLKRHNVTRLTARTDLEELAERGLLIKRRKGKENLYVPVQDLGERLGKKLTE